MNSKIKIIAAAVAIFVAGGVAGGFIGVNYGRPPVSQAEIAQHIRSHLKSREGLSEEQLTKIQPMIEQTATKLDAERQDTMRKVWFIFSDFHAAIAGPGELTPQQKELLAQSEREHMLNLKPTPSPAP